MASTSPPLIFAPRRRSAARVRGRMLQQRPGAARYVLDDMVEDVADRLAFLRHAPRKALVVGDGTGVLAALLAGQGAQVTAPDPMAFDDETPYPFRQFDFIASLGRLDTANDLPGALIHLRKALAPGGLMIAELVGAGSLPVLRRAMLAADGKRPAPRLHPAIDVRAGGQLLQRAGFADPVVDSRSLTVRFRSLETLVGDLRAQGLGNVLARSGPPLTRTMLERARAAFPIPAVEYFEILTLSGWNR